MVQKEIICCGMEMTTVKRKSIENKREGKETRTVEEINGKMESKKGEKEVKKN